MKVYVVTKRLIDLEETPAVLAGIYLTEKLADEARVKVDSQYFGYLAAVRAVELNTGGEPVFLLRAQDLFALSGINGYVAELLNHNQYEQAEQVALAITEVSDWQDENTDRLKVPDHQHVPAVGGESGDGG